MDFSDTERQLVILVTALAGLVHLLVPDTLLRTARYGYGWVLDVEFRPRDGATGRVRLVGALLLGGAATLWRRYG